MRAYLAALVLALPAAAQEAPPEPPGLMEEGLRQFMEGLGREMAPMLDDLEALRREAAPLLDRLEQRLADAMGDLEAYHPPEILPNGDIILRRRVPPKPEPEAPPAAPEGEAPIEL